MTKFKKMEELHKKFLDDYDALIANRTAGMEIEDELLHTYFNKVDLHLARIAEAIKGEMAGE